MDEDLGRIVLEGGGGGQMTESYELAMYFMARHTAIDCFEKRGRRGYLFIIGDELAYPKVKAARGRDGRRRRAPPRTSRPRPIVAEVRAGYDVYYILPAGSQLRGRRARCSTSGGSCSARTSLELDDLDAVCETIALTVGLGEDAIDLDEGLARPGRRRLGRRRHGRQGAGPADRVARRSRGRGRRVPAIGPPPATGAAATDRL